MNYPLAEIFLPMGAKEVKDEAKMEALWDDPAYIAEEKYDGSRYVSVGSRMFSRRVSDVTGFPVEKTENVPHIVDILSKYPNLILDGEVYYPGMTSNEVTSIMGASADKARWRQGFGEFQAPFLVGSKGKWRMDESQDWVDVPKKEVEYLLENPDRKPLLYVAFDIIRDFDGTWLTDLPWKERRTKLDQAIGMIQLDLMHDRKDSIKFIELSRVEAHDKRGFYKEIMDANGEGVILKNVAGTYIPDKKPMWNWVKVKKHITVDVVIMGFKDAKKEYSGEDLDTHPYWEDIHGTKYDFNCHALNEESLELHGYEHYKPISKFYYYGWIGAVTFGQFDPDNVVTMCDRLGENCQEFPQLKELGYFSGINEELRKDMTENPSKYIGECVEIGAMEQTKDGFYRHPQFSRLRPDKNPSECVIGG